MQKFSYRLVTKSCNWSTRKWKLIQILLDLEELEFLPTNKINGLYDWLQQLLPSLYNHERTKAGRVNFVTRVREGTWMGHVIGDIALERQSLTGMQVGFGRTRCAGEKVSITCFFSMQKNRLECMLPILH